jgi:outer membrane protein assembly factor BamE (lipoprotein component of BamABCDE complex)
MKPIKLLLAATLLVTTVASCGGGDGSAVGGRCLTDADVCQFQVGVSTKQQIRAALGNPFVTQSISDGSGGSIEQWAYICMPDQQSAQQVQFIFDANGVLMGRLAVSSGPNAPPAPTCTP